MVKSDIHCFSPHVFIYFYQHDYSPITKFCSFRQKYWFWTVSVILNMFCCLWHHFTLKGICFLSFPYFFNFIKFICSLLRCNLNFSQCFYSSSVNCDAFVVVWRFRSIGWTIIWYHGWSEICCTQIHGLRACWSKNFPTTWV